MTADLVEAFYATEFPYSVRSITVCDNGELLVVCTDLCPVGFEVLSEYYYRVHYMYGVPLFKFVRDKNE